MLVRMLQLLPEAALGLGLLLLAVRWGIVQSLRVRLLWPCCTSGFAWSGAGLPVLQAVSHSMLLVTDESRSLGTSATARADHGLRGNADCDGRTRQCWP